MFTVSMLMILSYLSSSSLTAYNEHLLMMKVDAISLWMLVIVMLLWVSSSYSEFIIKPAFIVMMIFLFFSFTMNNLTIFFLSFESTLIPILYTIIQDGMSQERLKASFYMFFYTIFSSLPLLFIILMMNNSLMYSFELMSMTYIYPSLFMLMIFAFMVKMPVFFFHAWLPKAHVEASTLGSVFLAGLLLKLGSYGFYRFANMFAMNLNSYILSLGIIASIISSMLCVIQTDLKVMIAFSSIVHMSMNLIILAQMKSMVEESFIMANLSHSLISAALFLGFGSNYSWLKSRSSLLLKGIFLLSPVFFFCWFVICFLNMSLPPSIGFIGEVLMTSIILSFTKNFFVIAILMSILFWLVGIYCLVLFTSISHGKYLQKSIMFFNNNNLCLLFFISHTLIPLVLTSWF
uniref:NADH-ubiquinone oxidoreductase chain 4 n=1 Tax=Stenostomum leucops TaxID=52061 RepID=A0A1U9IVY8_9PLAT|nr:NADH dehydrogenase subunit 4 [Stenostomum leucops]